MSFISSLFRFGQKLCHNAAAPLLVTTPLLFSVRKDRIADVYEKCMRECRECSEKKRKECEKNCELQGNYTLAALDEEPEMECSKALQNWTMEVYTVCMAKSIKKISSERASERVYEECSKNPRCSDARQFN